MMRRVGGIAVGAGLLAVWGCLIRRVLKDTRKETENRVLHQKLQVQEEAYWQLHSYLRESRKIQHDMKHRLVMAEQLLVRGDVRGGELYIRGFLEELDGTGAFPVGDCAWKTLLEMKRKRAEEQGIRFQADIGELVLERVEELDFCVLLGNLLDNAVEAQERLAGGREIRLHIREAFGIVFVNVSNQIRESVLQKNQRLVSTKAKREMHGLGLDSIREIVRRYGGTIRMREEDGWFRVEIWLREKK